MDIAKKFFDIADYTKGIEGFIGGPMGTHGGISGYLGGPAGADNEPGDHEYAASDWFDPKAWFDGDALYDSIFDFMD